MNVLARTSCTVLAGLLLAGCSASRPAGRPAAPAVSRPDMVVPAATAPASQPDAATPAQEAAEPAVTVVVEPATQPAPAPAPATQPESMPVVTVEPVEPLPAAEPVVVPEVVPGVSGPVTSAPITTAPMAFDTGLQRLLENQPAWSDELFAQVPAAEQQLLKAVLQGIATFRSKLGTDPQAAAAALAELGNSARPADVLKVPVVTLCSRVQGFGVYDTVTPQQLPAFRESGVVLYCEVQGFDSRRQELNWETRLRQQVSLIDAQGQTIWSDEPNTVVDLCRQVRQDFYIARIIHLPGNLSAGRYQLRVAIEDQLTGQKTQAELTIPVAAR